MGSCAVAAVLATGIRPAGREALSYAGSFRAGWAACVQILFESGGIEEPLIDVLGG